MKVYQIATLCAMVTAFILNQTYAMDTDRAGTVQTPAQKELEQTAVGKLAIAKEEAQARVALAKAEAVVVARALLEAQEKALFEAQVELLEAQEKALFEAQVELLEPRVSKAELKILAALKQKALKAQLKKASK